MANTDGSGKRVDREPRPFPERGPVGKLRALLALPFFFLGTLAASAMMGSYRIGKAIAGGDASDIF